MNQIDNIDAIETEAIVEQTEVVEADGQIVLPGMPELTEETESDELTINEIVEHVFAALGWTESTEATLYQLFKVVNGVLVIIGAQKVNKDGVLVDYRVSSQMMYQYGRNKMIIKGRSITGHELITMAQATPFVERFAAKFIR